MQITSTNQNASRIMPRFSRERLAFAAILLLAVFLHFFRLEQEGFANFYYAATVKSMLTNWHNFFFASFDPGGFVTVDKPPLGFWIQAGSAALLGFSGLALLLPQALAGVLSVALLYFLVRRVFGIGAGLIAALALTLTPISIAANRNNTIDGLLVFTSLLAAYAAMLAAERGKLRWLMACAILVGIGFNIKMLQAFMVLPAFFALYFFAAPLAWWKRLAHLAVATIVLAVVSFAYIAVVDLTPANARPFIGSSRNNTMSELVIGHNGISRLGVFANLFGLRATNNAPQIAQLPAPKNQPAPPQSKQQPQPKNQFAPPAPPNAPQSAPRGPNDENGAPDALRLFNKQLGGQASWLLPFALIGIIAAAWQMRVRLPLAREHQSIILWALWLVPQLIFFSWAGLIHRYYLEMLSPAIAALVGAGVAAMWRDDREKKWRGMLLPFALIITALVQIALLAEYPEWGKWLTPVVAVSIVGALALFVLKFAHRLFNLQSLISGFSLVALLIAPAAWSLTPVLSLGDSGLPFAGPELLTRARPPQNANANAIGDARLIEYLKANRNGARFLAATLNANTAAPIILATGEPVMALGGFSGRDEILTTEQLAARIAQNDVRLFLLPAQQPNELARWIAQNCASVPRNAWSDAARPAIGPNSAQELYRCGG